MQPVVYGQQRRRGIQSATGQKIDSQHLGFYMGTQAINFRRDDASQLVTCVK